MELVEVRLESEPPKAIKRALIPNTREEREEEGHVLLARHLILHAIADAQRPQPGTERDDARSFLMGSTLTDSQMLLFWTRIAGWNAAGIMRQAKVKWGLERPSGRIISGHGRPMYRQDAIPTVHGRSFVSPVAVQLEKGGFKCQNQS